MKNIIVTIGEILLGVVIFLFIFGTSTQSLNSEFDRMSDDVYTQTQKVAD